MEINIKRESLHIIIRVDNHVKTFSHKTTDHGNKKNYCNSGYWIYTLWGHWTYSYPYSFHFIKRKKKSVTGVDSLLGEVVEVRQWKETEGQVFIKGELWRAVSDVPLMKGDKAIIQNIEGLTLKVKPVGESVYQKQINKKFRWLLLTGESPAPFNDNFLLSCLLNIAFRCNITNVNK